MAWDGQPQPTIHRHRVAGMRVNKALRVKMKSEKYWPGQHPLTWPMNNLKARGSGVGSTLSLAVATSVTEGASSDMAVCEGPCGIKGICSRSRRRWKWPGGRQWVLGSQAPGRPAPCSAWKNRRRRGEEQHLAFAAQRCGQSTKPNCSCDVRASVQ